LRLVRFRTIKACGASENGRSRFSDNCSDTRELPSRLSLVVLLHNKLIRRVQSGINGTGALCDVCCEKEATVFCVNDAVTNGIFHRNEHGSKSPLTEGACGKLPFGVQKKKKKRKENPVCVNCSMTGKALERCTSNSLTDSS
jgi:hypothetical protein